MIPIILLVIIVGSIILTSNINSAREVNFSIQVEDANVKKDEEFTLKVAVSSDYEMGAVDAYVTYDDEILEFVSADKEGVVGASGTLHITEQFTEGVKEAVYEIRMKALEVGESDFKVYDTYVENYQNSNYMKINQTTAGIEITKNETEPSNATLSELLIVPGDLDKEFQPNVYEYSMKVAYDVEELIISAIPQDENSIVTIDTDLMLEKGDNVITITVTAPSGDTNDYKLNVYRAYTKDETIE